MLTQTFQKIKNRAPTVLIGLAMLLAGLVTWFCL